MEASARVLAERLEAHPAVTTVRYPGFGFLISFDVADGGAARRGRGGRRVDRERDEPRRHPHEDRVAPPLGGRPLPGGLLRLSSASRPPDVLWADLEQAPARRA